jgi:hypothetical protein
MTPLPEGSIWGAVAALLAVLLGKAIHGLVQRRNGGASIKLGERVASLEAKVAMLNGAGATLIASRLAALEVTIGSNTAEIGRLRDWKHDELQQQLQGIEGRLANLDLDVQELQGRKS